MSEQGMSGRTPVIALSLAAVALVTVLIAVIVVASRGGSAPAAARPSVEDPGPVRHRVASEEVVRLDRDTLESATDPTGIAGVKVTDAELRTALALGPADLITSISGRPTKRQFDVYDALLGASMMNATALYVELLRDGKPALLRWDLDGDLRVARTGTKKPARLGGIPGLGLPSSPAAPVSDPLLDTIKKIDDFTYEIPRSTVDAVLGNPGTIARGARVVPAMKNGQPAGLKIYAVRPSSIYAALGVKNGDTLRSINGFVFDSASAALDVYDRLKGTDALRIEIDRRGRPEVLKITVTP